jgi:DNA modification methylase
MLSYQPLTTNSLHVDAKEILSKQATANPTIQSTVNHEHAIHYTINPENHPITANASSYTNGKSGHPTRKDLQPTRKVIIKAIDNLQIRNAHQINYAEYGKQGCM